MAKQKKSTLLTRLFGNRNKVTDFMTEEQLQSPGRLILKNFLHNRLGMTGLIVFLLIFLLVMIGPKFYTLDLSYQDNTQLNVAPGMNMMKIPDGMKHKVADISPGTTYGVGVDTDGKVYIWGYTRITDTIDLKNIPEEVQNAKIVNVAAGYDHIVALDENGAVYVWGNKRLGQDSIPDKIQMAAAYGKNLGIKQIEASNQFSAAVTEDGELFLWGNGNQADIKIKKEYQGNIEKVALTTRAYVALTKDGAVVYSGFQKDNALVRIPEGLDSGVVDIAASSNAVAAVKEDGTVVVWGTCTNGENNVPAFESKPVELYGGRYHFTALMDDGEVISWGDNTHGQASVPASFNEKEIVTVYAGFYQNYAVTVDGGLPFLPFAMILSAIIGTRITVEQRMYLIMVVLGVLSWPGICHLIRAQILSQREQEYVTAAQALGVREKNIIFHHIIPNVMSLILVNATLSFATCMLTESSLSYMGFGIAPPTPTWGNMLTGANNSIVIQQYWWRWVFPAAIFGINLVGDALRDAVDPKSAER